VTAGEVYLQAARSAVDLVARPDVAGAWDAESALPKMTVGALAAHLGTQVFMVRDALTEPEVRTDEAPVPLTEHYTRSAWVRSGLDDDANVGIRDGAAREAAAGHSALVADLRAVLAEVADRLGHPDLPQTVRMPWWGWALTFDDFLVTRMMEIAVHSDDLASSVGVATPELPDTVLGPVLDLLVGVSVRRHGQTAVLRALSRAERAGSVTAF
jgi:hypothetical protein